VKNLEQNILLYYIKLLIQKKYQTIKYLPLKNQSSYSSPKGLRTKINFGNKVNTEINANNIAIPVKTPK